MSPDQWERRPQICPRLKSLRLCARSSHRRNAAVMKLATSEEDSVVAKHEAPRCYPRSGVVFLARKISSRRRLSHSCKRFLPTLPFSYRRWSEQAVQTAVAKSDAPPNHNAMPRSGQRRHRCRQSLACLGRPSFVLATTNERTPAPPSRSDVRPMHPVALGSKKCVTKKSWYFLYRVGNGFLWRGKGRCSCQVNIRDSSI